MKRWDAVVVGQELEALVAALRLADSGASVTCLTTGMGSLHYCPSGLQVLGPGPNENGSLAVDPIAGVETLAANHPFRLVGAAAVRQSLDWFLNFTSKCGQAWLSDGRNAWALRMAGLEPTFAHPRSQALLADVRGKRVAIASFNLYRDFSAELALSQCRRLGLSADIIHVDATIPQGGGSVIARELDDMSASARVFNEIRRGLPKGTEAVLFPAVLGLENHESIVALGENVLEARVAEMPTLPPSVPGMRLFTRIRRALQRLKVPIRSGLRHLRADICDRRCHAIIDDVGHRHEADSYLSGTGGVLMGGLEVDSRGIVRDPIFGLEVHQTMPLAKKSSSEALDALHETGIHVNSALQPMKGGEVAVDNIRVIGAMLANWNPIRERSSEGVAIATGWAAAGSIIETRL